MYGVQCRGLLILSRGVYCAALINTTIYTQLCDQFSNISSYASTFSGK